MRFSRIQQQIGNGAVAIEFALIAVAMMLIAPVQLQIQAQDTAASKTKSKQELPSGEEVMAKHIAKTGGKAAYDKIKNRVAESTLEIMGQGVKLDLTTYAARPNKILIKIDSELTGKIDKGCNGKVFWENSLISGPVIHDGAQKSMGLRDSTFERFVYWKSIYESAECTSIAKVGDTDCYEVVLTPKKTDDSTGEESPLHLFVDKSDYLIRKVQAVIESEAGRIDVVAYPEDYRTVDGILFSHKLRMELLGQKREVTVKSVKHNVDLPKNQFDLPDEVKELID